MRSILFTRRWLVRHVVAIVLIVACLRLGWWQWDRAQESGGSAQNLGYALQWPMFGVFVGYAWVRMLRHESGTSPLESPDEITPEAGRRRTVQVRRNYIPPAPPECPTDPEADEQLAAYNRYLAALNPDPRTALPEEQ